MKAVIKTGGKQYYVSENDVIYVEKLNGSLIQKLVIHLLKVQKLLVRLKNKVKLRKLGYLLINVKIEAIVVLWVIDNHILKLQLLR